MHVEQTISWTAIAAIIVFSLTQFSTLLSKILEVRRQQRHLAKAIHAELQQLILQSGEGSSVARFNQFVDRCSIQILNSYAVPLYSSSLLDSNVDKLPLLPSSLISKVVEVYGYIRRMNGLIEHFKSQEFIAAPDYVHDSMKNILKDTNLQLINCSSNLLESLEKYDH